MCSQWRHAVSRRGGLDIPRPGSRNELSAILMCGIAGILTVRSDADGLESRAKAMAAMLDHRGPDSSGSWSAVTEGVALGHARLSVIDVSEAGHQPMSSHCERYVMTYNGEIYNFAELREQLEGLGHRFTGRSDTEVLLQSIAEWGLESALQAVDGMFALAVWDRRDRCLTLARDKVGEKPLYYGWYGSDFLFASELKAFTVIDGFKPAIDREALALYVRYNYIPDPHCVFKGFRKLTPGSWCVLSAASAGTLPQVREYWSLEATAEAGLNALQRLDEREAVEQLDILLRRVVQQRAVADVPLGAFLSGGIDSSIIVALMQAQSTEAIKTFSIGFDIPGYNEAPQAKAVAAHLGTDHTELYVDAAVALSVIPQMCTIYDEPFADSSQIPTFLVARLARRAVTVAMSGDAGDELFAGYLRYTLVRTIWRRVASLPMPMRGVAARVLHALSPRAWDLLFGTFSPLLPVRYRYASAGDKIHKLARLLTAIDPLDLYVRLVSLWQRPSELVMGVRDTVDETDMKFPSGAAFDSISKMMVLDAKHYLPGDILTKVDRAAMACSLETRIPFLDPAVIDFAWRLPLDHKLRGNEGKWILRRVLERYLPRPLFDRPKQGFGVPIDTWLRGPLREWAEDLLNEQRLRAGGYFEPQAARDTWHAHLAGGQNLQYQLWGILNFEAWRDVWGY